MTVLHVLLFAYASVSTIGKIRADCSQDLALTNKIISTMQSILSDTYAVPIVQGSFGSTLNVCDWKVGIFYCPSGTLIQIISGDYGRFDATTCAKGVDAKFLGNTHCSFTFTEFIGYPETGPFDGYPMVSSYLQQLCDGKSMCMPTANPTKFGDPCAGTSKYMAAQFTCKIIPQPAARPSPRPTAKTSKATR